MLPNVHLRVVALCIATTTCGTSPRPISTPQVEVGPKQASHLTAHDDAATSALLAVVSPDADPCDDFFAYACGASTHGSPGDGGSQISAMANAFDDALWNWMTRDASAAEVGQYVAACRDEQAVGNIQGELSSWLTRIDGVNDDETFLALAGQLQRLGVPTIFASPAVQYGVSRDPLLAPLRNPTPDVAVAADRLRRLGAAPPDQVASKVTALETRLDMAASPDAEALRVQRFSDGPLAPYVKALRLPAGSPLWLRPYRPGLRELLASQDAATLRAFLKLRLLEALAEDLPTSLRNGTSVYPDRGSWCDASAEMRFDWHLMRAFGRTWLGSANREQARTLMKDVRAEIRREVATDPSLPEQARDGLTRVLDRIQLRIGWVDEPWGSVPSMDASDHIANVMALGGYRFDREVSGTFGTVNGQTGGRPVDPIAAWSDSFYGDVTMGLGMLQPPVFDGTWPRWRQLASLGMISAHELHHAFGRDGLARRFEVAGASPKVADLLPSPSPCMADALQRSAAQEGAALEKFYAHHPDWMSETRADVGALNSAFAIFSQERESGSVPTPEGLHPDALFFLGYAQFFCAWDDPRAVERSRARVNAAVALTPAFATAFECKPTDRETVTHTCGRW